MKKWFLRGLTLGLMAVLPVVNDTRAADVIGNHTATHQYASATGKTRVGHHPKKNRGGKHVHRSGRHSARFSRSHQ